MRTRPSILNLMLRSSIMTLAVMGTLWAQTTGKISGRVVDNATGEPLPGANVLVEGTALGAASDADGNYFIFIAPGTYDVRADYAGYAEIIQSEVRVLMNLTTTADFSLTVEAFAGEEVRVVAVRPTVQPDVSANIANVRAEEIEDIPVAGVSEYINLQAGIEPGMVIRGLGTSGMAFVVDGNTMRDGRSNDPFSAVSYTAMSEVQIQTGGFNAEFGNVRSGLINVVTKDPSASRYMADILYRYSPTHQMYFGKGLGVDNPEGLSMKPYLNDAVAWKGTEVQRDTLGNITHGAWDNYTRRQYPFFEGWNAISASAKLDDDPDDVSTFLNNLTPAQFQDLFKYYHRKDTDVAVPEYDIDLSFGGPVIPGLSRSLGNLRFLASYRKTQDPYAVPGYRKARIDETIQLKVLADLSSTMKLQVNGLYGTHSGEAYYAYEIVEDPMPQWGGIGAYPWGGASEGHMNYAPLDAIYGLGRTCQTDVTRQQMGAVFTHTLSPSTFYRVSLSSMTSDYDTGPDHRRDELSLVKDTTDGSILRAINAVDSMHVMVDSLGDPVTSAANAVYDGYYYMDESPFGSTWNGSHVPGSGLRLGGHWGRARDTSSITITTAKFDLTNQTNAWSQLRAGLELNFYDFDMKYESKDSVIVHLVRSKQHWQRQAMQAAFYLQEKLEFRGMIANLGLRLDYYDPGKDWWDLEAYDQLLINAFLSTRQEGYEERGLKTLDKEIALSPRVGVSFPITAASKLFFNYGHFRDIPNQRQLYEIQTRWQGGIHRIGNPEHPLLKTVAYELGFEQAILDQYLLRVSGYYQDRSNQPATITFTSVDNEVDYRISQPISYGDTRGVEITLNKARGKFMGGFVNYTYMIRKSGNFGFRQQYENPTEQSNHERTTEEHYQSKPVAMPFGRFNIDFFTPPGFGPGIAGLHPLGDWRLDLLGQWRAGETYTWTGPGGVTVSGLTNNVRMRDYATFDIRLSKNFDTGIGRAQFFVDITNVFNLKYMYFRSGGGDIFDLYNQPRDYEEYMTSLHLPKKTWEEFDQTYYHPYGDDRPGVYRKTGVDFVPIEAAADFESLPTFIVNVEKGWKAFLESDRRILGWADDEDEYYEFNKTSWEWEAASKSFVDQVLEDKAYIDMPNGMFRTFQNPRSILFGLRVWF